MLPLFLVWLFIVKHPIAKWFLIMYDIPVNT